MTLYVDYDWPFWFQQLDKCECIAEIYALCTCVCHKCNYDLDFERIPKQVEFLCNNGWPILGRFLQDAFSRVKEM